MLKLIKWFLTKTYVVWGYDFYIRSHWVLTRETLILANGWHNLAIVYHFREIFYLLSWFMPFYLENKNYDRPDSHLRGIRRRSCGARSYHKFLFIPLKAYNWSIIFERISNISSEVHFLVVTRLGQNLWKDLKNSIIRAFSCKSQD